MSFELSQFTQPGNRVSQRIGRDLHIHNNVQPMPFTFNTLKEGMGCGGETAAHCPKQPAYAAGSSKQSAVNERPAADQQPIRNAQNEQCTISSFPVASTSNDQLIVRRRVRRETPPEEKDERYYERRRITNLAAKRSRDARRMREEHIRERLRSVERENDNLKEHLKQVYAEKCDLQMRLDKMSSEFEAYKRAIFMVHGHVF